MVFPRASGLLLHITSLPGPLGIGDLGPAAYAFVDFLARTGQSLWQVLPIGPTGYGNSPYQSISSFAGNPLLVSPELLLRDGLLAFADCEGWPEFPDGKAEIERARPIRERLLELAFADFEKQTTGPLRAEFAAFQATQQAWLEDYSLFAACRRRHADAAWTEWDRPLVRRDPAALQTARTALAREIRFASFVQFLFWRQWHALKAYANERGVRIIGDVPIFVAHDSADVWANQSLFALRPDGRPAVVAGVPPDYFSATGQLWGNPLYRWEAHAAEGYAWWTRRLAHSFRAFDLVRIDHFRGFEAYWEIPGDAPDARPGRWVQGPGAALFRAAESRLGPLPLIAEDLGLITPEVDALRHELKLPGMKVLQFAFGDDPKAPDYQPHNFERHCVVYTGTHDNETTVGWFHSQPGEGTTRTAEQTAREIRRTLDYAGTTGREIHWDFIRLAWASVAQTAIAPMQDVLGLGSEARMNLPGTSQGNWLWRMRPEALTPAIEERLAKLTRVYQRGTPASPDRKPRALSVSDGRMGVPAPQR